MIKKKLNKKKKLKEKKVPYVIYLSPKLKEKFKKYAAKNDVFLTDLGEMIFSKFFNAN